MRSSFCVLGWSIFHGKTSSKYSVRRCVRNVSVGKRRKLACRSRRTDRRVGQYGWAICTGRETGAPAAAASSAGLRGNIHARRRDRRRCGYGFAALAARRRGSPTRDAFNEICQ